MPFKQLKGMLRKKDEGKPVKKPILDETPKNVPREVYDLPTMDDLPDAPLQQTYESRETDEHVPHPDVASFSEPETRTPQQYQPQPAQQPQPSQQPAPQTSDQPVQTPHQRDDHVLDALDRIERRVMDLDRRLALLERGLAR